MKRERARGGSIRIMSPANATEIEIAGGDKFQVGKIYDVKLTTGFEFKGIVLAYDPDPHFVIFHILSDVKINHHRSFFSYLFDFV